MAYELKLPDLGEGLTECEIARWLVSEGQEVAEDDPLVEIQTDKTTVEIPSPAAGTVSQILVEEGKIVAVGTVLVVIGDGEVQHAQPAPAPAEGKAKATPLVRRIAEAHAVEADVAAGAPPQHISIDAGKPTAGVAVAERSTAAGGVIFHFDFR